MKNPAPVQILLSQLESQLEQAQLQVVALSAAVDALHRELDAYSDNAPSWTHGPQKTHDDDDSGPELAAVLSTEIERANRASAAMSQQPGPNPALDLEGTYRHYPRPTTANSDEPPF